MQGREVRTAHEHAHAVDGEEERRPCAVAVGRGERLLDELDCPEADAFCDAV